MLINRALVFLLKGSERILIKRCFLEVLQSLLSVSKSYVVAMIITTILINKVEGNKVMVLLGVFAALLCIEALLKWFNSYFSVKCGNEVKKVLRNQLFNKIVLLGPAYSNTQRSGEICSALVGKVEALDPYYSVYLPSLVSTIITSAAIIIYLLSIDLYVGLISLLGIILVLFVPSLWLDIMNKRGQEDWRLHAEFHSDMLDNLQGMTTLKAFNASEARGKKLEKQAWEMHKSTMRNLSVSLIESGILQFGAAAGSVIAIGTGVLRASSGAIPPETMVFVLFLVLSCFSPVFALINAWHLGFRGVAASPKIFELLNEDTLTDIFATHVSVKGTNKSDVKFSNVTFGYVDGISVLKNLSFSIEEGKTTALVGKSGSGKSTIINLLSGFYSLNQGNITVGGKKLDQYKEEELRELIGVVWQEPYLMYGTVEENIRMGKEDATMDEIIEASKKANIHEFIQSTSDGYNTLIGERGMRLSGGEKQRLAIARCFLRESKLIILDEATANLDGDNEIRITDSINKLTKNKTTLVIAHRLSTVQNADKICVLENGEIVQTGVHQDLIHENGVYRSLMKLQWGGEMIG